MISPPQTKSLDMSSFPLLRIDQLPYHETKTLIQSEESLNAMIGKTRRSNCNNVDCSSTAIEAYSNRLIVLIQQEIARRRVQMLLSSSNIEDNNAISTSNPKINNISMKQQSKPPQQSTSNSSPYNYKKKAICLNQSVPSLHKTVTSTPTTITSTTSRRTSTESVRTSSFVVSPRGGRRNSKKSNFRSRARAACISMRKLKEEKSNTNDNAQKQVVLDEEKKRRRMIAIVRMKKRRLEKQEEKKLQKIRLAEVRKRKENELKVKMECAAAEARIEARETGKSDDQANIDAAAAATEVMCEADVDIVHSDDESSLESSNLSSEMNDLVSESDILCSDSGDDDFRDTSTTEEQEVSNDMESIELAKQVSLKEPNDTVITSHISSNNSLSDSRCDYLIATPPSASSDTSKICRHSKGEASQGDSYNACSNVQRLNTEMNSTIEDPVDDSHRRPTFKPEYDIATITRHIPLEIGATDLDSSHDDKSDEVTWEPFIVSNPISKDTEHSSSKMRCSQGMDEGSLSFTDIYPNFFNIFTTFAQCKNRNHNSRLDPLVMKECLEYQIKVNTALVKSKEDWCCSNIDDTVVRQSLGKTLFYKINSTRTEVTSIISDVLDSLDDLNRDWEDMADEIGLGNYWNLLWTWKKVKINPEHLLVSQKISRFQHASSLTRKDNLKKQLEKVFGSCRGEEATIGNIMPLTFVLPCEYNAFVSAYSSMKYALEDESSNLWIMKPVCMSRGRGITLVNDIGKVSYAVPTVIQRYVTKPMLYRGYKFDLRLYITVMSFSPLEAFIYKEGFARFGSRLYSSSPNYIDDFRIHLTNSSIQKNYSDDIHSLHPSVLAGEYGGGNKVAMSWLWRRLEEEGIDTSMLWERICDLCLKTLLAVNDEIPFQPNAFEIFGFDVIVDQDLKPWLIEVNSCPSLSRDSELDIKVKEALIEDTITLLGPCMVDRVALTKICSRRLFHKKKGTTHGVSSKQQLESDLREIFMSKIPRQYGDRIDESRYEPLVLKEGTKLHHRFFKVFKFTSSRH